MIGSTALALVAIAAPVRAADGGAGGVGDAASIGNGGNGGQTGSAGTAGGQGLGGGGAGGTAGLPPGGNGGTGASGFNTSPGIGAAGGGGGGGASGNSMFSFGGVGGNGGNAAGTVSTGYGGGGGGGGGNGVDVVDFPTNDTPSIGGRGGNGGNAGGSSSGAGNGGSGGAGGYGVGLFTYSFTNVAGVTIGGGGGGNGGSGSGMQSGGVPGNGGAGGVGGAGIVASFANIFNAGTISGGNGGAGGNAGTTGAAGVAGAGGVGIIGDRLTIVNSGAITGGLAGDGVTRANAITFTGGTNSLKLEAGYQITGNVQAASRADVLVIGGRADSQFSVNNLGDTSQYRGFGRLLKTDASTWTVSGRTDFNGPFDIEAGTVRLGGFLSNTRVTVGRASLVGSGEIGSLDARAGSIISPGRGTDRTRFDVNGDVTFRQGSTFQVNVNNSGLSDIIRATGNATLEGGRVEVMAEDASNYNRTTNATILTASRVTGQFAEVTSDLAFLTPSLSYGPDRVELVLTRNDASFRSVATTPNQQQIAGAIAALGINDPVLIAVLKQNPDGARAAFDILNGEAGPSSITQQFELMSIFSALMMGGGPAFGGFGGEAAALFAGGEVEASYAADMPGRTPTTTRMPIGNLDPKMFSMWGSGFGSFGSTSSNGNAGALTRDVAGFVVGVDATFDQMYRIGVAGGFTRSNFDIRSRASSGESDTGFGAIYGGARFGPVTLRLGGLFAGMSSDTRRAIVFPGFADNVTAQFGGTGLLGFGEVGYRFDVGTVGIEPFVGGSGMRLSRDGYTERGGPAALTVLQRDYDIQTFTAGVRASARLSADSPFTVRGQLAYRRAFGDVVPTALLAFAGGGTQFQTAGIPIDVNALVAEAGIGWQATKDVALELAYTGQVGQRAEDHGVKGSFLWKF